MCSSLMSLIYAISEFSTDLRILKLSIYAKIPPPPNLPGPCCEKMHLYFFSSLKILIKRTFLYFYEPTDDLSFQAKKHCVLKLSINISCLNKMC